MLEMQLGQNPLCCLLQSQLGAAQTERSLDGRNRAMVIAESLARLIAAIRITSILWWSYDIPPKNIEFGPHGPCVRCSAIWITRLAFVGVVFVSHGTAEWLARVDRVCRTLAIGDWRFCPSKMETETQVRWTEAGRWATNRCLKMQLTHPSLRECLVSTQISVVVGSLEHHKLKLPGKYLPYDFLIAGIICSSCWRHGWRSRLTDQALEVA